jgi:hypothetical protein
MIMPYMMEDGANDATAQLVVEVERETFEAVLKQMEKPLVLENEAWRRHFYYVRFAGYFFLYRSKDRYEPSGAVVMPIKKFHASPAVVA